MSHLDEGTLHALLDGELDAAETRQIEAHLNRCATCGTRLDEIKSVRSEADSLIESLEAGPATAVAAPPRRPPARSDAWSGPILLIPELPEVVLERQQRRRRWLWAAGIVLAIGVTSGGFELYRQSQVLPLAFSNAERSTTQPAADAVLSPQEAVNQPAPAAAPSDSVLASAPSQDSAPPSKPAAPPTDVADAGDDPMDVAALGKAASGGASKQAQPRAALEERERSSRAERSGAQEQQQAQRRRLDVANDLTQVPPPPAPAPVVSNPVVEPPPPPPTPEERAQIHMRIGRDEAFRQLGGPMHVIEGMSPMLIGLVQGRLAPGMDSTRPVVRVVYEDASRLILLDQQHMNPGQSPGPSSPLRLILDDVIVRLHGEPSANVLRNLVPRIR